ncbi:MAG: hypothetical protein A2V99_05535 [Spirochaetes bacterium RBG_16_67_19]|nr:MAG: hypothetical protein A2064_11030 [Spirochaetes bacterium GWB1_66_5]OHD70350.1 MAG: hypothetical protein A2V99_05535 [Spirochaetes bacterium RBG_16_67_19]
MKTLLAFLLTLLLLGCAPAEQPRLPALGRAEISGARLWQRISAEADFEHWAFWPGHEELQPGQSPHGQFHEVYINYLLEEALPAAGRRAPNGSLIVKENFDADRRPTNLTVMAKVEGYDPANGDWFWAAYDPQGKVQAEGRLQSCIDCHEGMKDNDYIIIRRLDLSLPEQ